jgi:hypothetical protein
LEEFKDLADRLECNWPTWWYKPTRDAASIYACWRTDWRMPVTTPKCFSPSFGNSKDRRKLLAVLQRKNQL